MAVQLEDDEQRPLLADDVHGLIDDAAIHGVKEDTTNI